MASYDNKVLKGDQLVVYTQKVKEGLASKQDKISADSKLDYSLIANTPTIPTNNNQLENGAGYQTANDVETAISGKGYQTSAQVETAITNKGYTTMAAVEGKGYQTSQQVQDAITSAIGGIGGFKFEIVENLPSTGSSNVIYLKLKGQGTEGNIYTEYAYINNKWEVIGDTSIALDFLTNAEINQIWTDAV